MESAYDDLYREFVHLRTICLRQAALLQKLSRELHKQQCSNGYSDKDGSIDDSASTVVQWGGAAQTQDSSIPPLVATNGHASPRSSEGQPCAAGLTSFSALLVEDMGKLGLDTPNQRQIDAADGQATLQPPSPGSRSPSSWEVHPRGDSRVTQPYGTARFGPLLDSDGLNNSSGAFMSEMELQSQVCEFCCATFPGNTATRGEFLRHLHTHIT